MKKFKNKWDAIAALDSLGKGEVIEIDVRQARIVQVHGQKAIRFQKDTSIKIDRPRFTRTAKGWAR